MAIVDEEVKVKDVKTTDPLPDYDVIDIDLSITNRKKFRINGDNSKIVELNPSDLSIISRLKEADKKFADCIKQLEELADFPTETEEQLYELGEKFGKIDSDMRDVVDYIFQSNVSEVCIPKGQGSMYDPIQGKYRYEHIIESLVKFYTGNIQNEYKTMKANVSKKTAKYTKKK